MSLKKGDYACIYQNYGEFDPCLIVSERDAAGYYMVQRENEDPIDYHENFLLTIPQYILGRAEAVSELNKEIIEANENIALATKYLKEN